MKPGYYIDKFDDLIICDEYLDVYCFYTDWGWVKTSTKGYLLWDEVPLYIGEL